MVTCQNCGLEMEDHAKFCKNCGSEIIRKTPAEEVNETKFCSQCGFEMNSDMKFCPECGASTTAVPKVAQNNNNAVDGVCNPDKNEILALILSFLIIGLGQVYIGLTKKGIILFVAAIIAGILTTVIIGWLLWLIIWFYAMYDAYNSTNKMKNGEFIKDGIDFDNLF